MFGTDGEYTAFASVALGQFEPTMDHMRGLRDVSEIANNRSGKVVHEVVTDGSIWFGANEDPGNTDETVKFPSIVALLWRWTGDDGFRDEMYDFTVRNMQYVAANLDEDDDGWLEGLGNVERPGMGPEKLDNNVYYIRGLYDLADMARSKRDWAIYNWAEGHGGRPPQPVRGHVVDGRPGPARRLAERDRREDPAEALDHGHADGRDPEGRRPRSAGPRRRSTTARARSRCTRPRASAASGRTTAVSSTRVAEAARRARARHRSSASTRRSRPSARATTAVWAATQQKRYIDANVETMFSQPATNGTPDEMPGAMPEIVPSPGFDATGPNDKNIDRCWTCRAMFIQAWGNMGTAWPVVNQHFGVRPDLGRDRLEIVPQMPSRAPIAAEDIRLGDGSVDVAGCPLRQALRHEGRHPQGRPAAPAHRPYAAARDRRPPVRLDGRRVSWRERRTNRGLEVTVRAREGDHTLVVETG